MAKSKKTKTLNATKTDRAFYYADCTHCNGTGRVNIINKLKGWYIDYHYQDGHDQSGPYTEEQA